MADSVILASTIHAPAGSTLDSREGGTLASPCIVLQLARASLHLAGAKVRGFQSKCAAGASGGYNSSVSGEMLFSSPREMSWTLGRGWRWSGKYATTIIMPSSNS